MGYKRIFQIGVYGILAGLFYALLQFGSEPLPLWVSIAGGLFLSLSYCLIEVIAAKPAVRALSFRNLLLLRGSFYTILISSGLVLIFIISLLANHKFPGTPDEKVLVFGDWVKHSAWPLILFYAFLAGFASQLIYLLVNSRNFGFWTGKYRKPLEEDRIFMMISFSSGAMDMSLLNTRKKVLTLQEIVSDIQELIEESDAELYRSEEDMIILNWSQYPGEHWERCITLFWQSVAILEKNRNKYKSRFGYTPFLKASLHFDSVLITEVGVGSRELVYSGDGIRLGKEALAICQNEYSNLVVTEKFLQCLPENKKAALAKGEESALLKGSMHTYKVEKPALHSN